MLEDNYAVTRNSRRKVVSRWWYIKGDYYNIDCIKFRGVELINKIPYYHFTTLSGVSMFEMAESVDSEQIQNYFKN